MTDTLIELNTLRAEAQASLAAVPNIQDLQEWYNKYLARKGALKTTLRSLGTVPEAERRELGRVGNEVRQELEESFEQKKAELERKEAESSRQTGTLDVTLPGRPWHLGKLHPTTRTLRDIYAIFSKMGFGILDGPEVETDEYNFELLNMPEDHPARDMWDTFYLQTPGLILRTHTSPGQILAMRQYAPEPVRFILPGKCYRNEDLTARSEIMFYQVEGIAVGKDITLATLKSVLTEFTDQMFGPGRRLRFRKSYFPFTEPSMEVDVSCILCGGAGCKICKYTGWLEILGCGMVHPIVLRNGGYDPEEVSGFAFGMGPDRITMLKYGITDIRYFFSNDFRFLERVG